MHNCVSVCLAKRVLLFVRVKLKVSSLVNNYDAACNFCMGFVRLQAIKGMIMKNIVLCAAVIVFSISCVAAQLRKIPASVTDAFASRYPHAEKVEWRDKITSFEAGFTLNNVGMKAGFSGKGQWKYSEKSISFDDLPAGVKDGFAKSKYADWKKGNVTEVLEDGKELQYKVYAEKSSPFQKKYLYFNTNGKLLRDVLTL